MGGGPWFAMTAGTVAANPQRVRNEAVQRDGLSIRCILQKHSRPQRFQIPLDAAAGRAGEGMASASAVIVPSDFSHNMWDTPDVDGEPSPALPRRSVSKGRVGQS